MDARAIANKKRARPPLERLMERVAAEAFVRPGQTEPCWTWTGPLNSDGYAAMWGWDRVENAHRIAYKEMVGPIPAGLVIDHLCCNRACQNPAHMEPVLRRVNTQRGSEQSGERRTHCRHGHIVDGIRHEKERPPRRYCKTCAAAASQRYRKRMVG